MGYGGENECYLGEVFEFFKKGRKEFENAFVSNVGDNVLVVRFKIVVFEMVI